MKGRNLVFVMIGPALFGAAATIVAIFGFAFIQFGENVFPVWIENDSKAPLLVKQCGDSCADVRDEVRLLPDEQVGANTVADIPNWWRVSEKPEAVVRTSQVQECPP